MKLSRKLFLQKIIIFTLLLLPVVGFGCEVCRGNPNSSLTAGMDMAILTLLGVIVSVLGGFGSFFIYLRKKSMIHQINVNKDSTL